MRHACGREAAAPEDGHPTGLGLELSICYR